MADRLTLADLTELRQALRDGVIGGGPREVAVHAWAWEVVERLLPGLLAEVERLRAAAGPHVTHACPPDRDSVTSCCGRMPFDLPVTDRLTLDDTLVTCGRAAAPASEDDELAELREVFSAKHAEIAASSTPDQWATLDPFGHPIEQVLAKHRVTGTLADELRAALRAGSPPPTPAPTRERLIEALTETYREYDGRAVSVFEAMADAVLALLSEPAPTLHGWVSDSEDFGSEHGDYTALTIHVRGTGHHHLTDHHVALVDEGDTGDHPDWGRSDAADTVPDGEVREAPC